MATYNLSQLLNKSIFVIKDTECKRAAIDNYPVFYTVKKGNSLGRLKGWVSPNTYRDSYWFEFEDVYKKTFYVKIESGRFSISALNEQGALTVKEEVEQAKKKEEDAKKDGFDKTKEIATIGLYAVIAIVVAQLAKTFKSN